MKIALVTNGGISIPPNGWGAIELITWEYKLGIEKMGHQADIVWLNDVNSDYDIAHVHACNLAHTCIERNIPYVFSFHDHHPISYGKENWQYEWYRQAFEGSVFSICPAEWIVDYFESDKLRFLSHGVNTSFFHNQNTRPQKTKLLCIASNGAFGDDSYDRKGFRPAIEAARTLNLEITIAGTQNNENFFSANPDLDYEKLTKITDNPNQERVRDLYNSHSIFLHPSSMETGHPNLTILESISCGTPVVGTYRGQQKIESLYRIENPTTQELIEGILSVMVNYESYCRKTVDDAKRFDWDNVVQKLVEMYITAPLNT